MAWFTTATPALNQLGATIGRGLSSGGGAYAPVDYTDVLENLRKQAQDEADRKYALDKQELDQQYKISRANAKTQQERNAIDRWKSEQDVQLARDRLAEDTRQFNVNTGYGLVKTLAEAGQRPADYFMAADLARGYSQMPGTSGFLQALQNNVQLPGYGAQGGTPTVESYGTLLAKLGGAPVAAPAGGAPGSPQTPQLTANFGQNTGTGTPPAGGTNPVGWTPAQNNLAAIAGIGAQGAHKLGGGALEQLTPTELALFKSGLGASGFDSDTFLSQYGRSRIGNSGNYRAA